jgi:predicted nucleic acid-binding Zn ribbon protein|tara:strand:+ start:247 stop:522 length:276 start_codon:yes stop_codon:yes gene_type:complete
MPTYIFKNTKTQEVFEQQMRISELDEFKTNNPNLIQVPTAPSFRLKGTGWYETDFKTGNKKNIAKSDNDSQSSSKTEKKENSTVPTKKESS